MVSHIPSRLTLLFYFIGKNLKAETSKSPNKADKNKVALGTCRAIAKTCDASALPIINQKTPASLPNKNVESKIASLWKNPRATRLASSKSSSNRQTSADTATTSPAKPTPHQPAKPAVTNCKSVVSASKTEIRGGSAPRQSLPLRLKQTHSKLQPPSSSPDAHKACNSPAPPPRTETESIPTKTAAIVTPFLYSPPASSVSVSPPKAAVAMTTETISIPSMCSGDSRITVCLDIKPSITVTDVKTGVTSDTPPATRGRASRPLTKTEMLMRRQKEILIKQSKSSIAAQKSSENTKTVQKTTLL